MNKIKNKKDKLIKISFCCIGFQKAGSTFLHEILRQNKKICLPEIKETKFFADDERYMLGYNWYHDNFLSYGNQKIYGEIDPDYIFYEKSLKRIHSYNPNI